MKGSWEGSPPRFVGCSDASGGRCPGRQRDGFGRSAVERGRMFRASVREIRGSRAEFSDSVRLRWQARFFGNEERKQRLSEALFGCAGAATCRGVSGYGERGTEAAGVRGRSLEGQRERERRFRSDRRFSEKLKRGQRGGHGAGTGFRTRVRVVAGSCGASRCFTGERSGGVPSPSGGGA